MVRVNADQKVATGGLPQGGKENCARADGEEREVRFARLSGRC